MAWFVLARALFIAAVGYSPFQLHPLAGGELSNVLFGFVLGVLIVVFEVRLRDTSVTHMIGALIGGAMSLGDIQNTMFDYTLGRRPEKSQPRPLEKLELRAAFDKKMEIIRVGANLNLKVIPIAIDRTPLRIQGTIGSSLYRHV